MKVPAKQLPPYARELLAARRRGRPVNLFVHAGDYAWRRAKSRPPGEGLCLPSDDFPAFDWRCIEDLSLVLVVWNRPPEFTAELARHLVRSGAALVAAIGRDESGTAGKIYKPEPAPVAAA